MEPSSTTRSKPAATPDEYRQLFGFADQLLLWLADRDPAAYLLWARAFGELDGPDVGALDHALYEQIQREIGPLQRPSLVLHFAADPQRAARWWLEHVHPSGHLFDEDGYWGITLDACELGFHPEDDARNRHGASTVAYWPVAVLDATRIRLIDAGCRPLRGPLDIEPGRSICQLVDPHDITFGLEGPC